MRTFMFTVAAILTLSVSFASESQAAPNVSNVHVASHYQPAKTISVNNTRTVSNFAKYSPAKVSNYHLTNGTRFAHGYFYRGKQHNHWTSHRWDARYGCECYYDSCCSCWYYWCQPAGCYYPVTYCPYRTYNWTPVVSTPYVPVAACTSVTQPISVQRQTITRTLYATTTVCNQPAMPVSNYNSYGPGPVGGVQASNIPPIPGPLPGQ